MLVAIICPGYSVVTTRVGDIRVPSSAKSDPGVSASTIILLVSKDTDSRFAVCVLVPITLNPSLACYSWAVTRP